MSAPGARRTTPWSAGPALQRVPTAARTARRAVADWMGSSGHRANILNCSLKDIGVGVAVTSNGPWWVQNFGVRR
ncbi:CAP domain-containing protein [Streptomyces sp. NPDC006324]|uniref:CAP domain-containing protein n=1 Tax=Streptomyces sp. NPDC006324 TaxID=3156751 RepID=UPI0033B96B83